MQRDGRQALIEQFLADGVSFMFGNPGTVEQGFLDVMGAYSQRLRYVLCLQESVAVAMADGYARATQRLGLVQLHSGVGLGNGIGCLYQAFRGHSPLLVIAGEAGRRYEAMDAQMAADLVAIARPVTKYAIRATHPDSLLRVVRRAIKIALTPPTGPVFVSLPMDVLDAPNSEDVRPSLIPSTRTAPDDSLVERAAELLRSAQCPLILMGDGVAQSGASNELERVARIWGAEVWGVNSSEINIDPACPLYRGSLGHMFGADSSAQTVRGDAILICGTYVFPEVFPEVDEKKIFDPKASIVHVDLDAHEIAKNHRVDLGLVSDPRLTLSRLADSLERMLTPEQRQAATDRVARLAQRAEADAELRRRTDESREDSIPAPLSAFTSRLAKKLSPSVIVFDEALTQSGELTGYLLPRQPGSYFQLRGGSLGLAFPGAIGIQLAHPDRQVISFCGDGGAMYTCQALWTAAHCGTPVKFIVCNNRSYRLLKLNLEEYWTERGDAPHAFPACFDITGPEMDFVSLAESAGVPGERVMRTPEMDDAIDRALAADGPYLIEVVTAA